MKNLGIFFFVSDLKQTETFSFLSTVPPYTGSLGDPYWYQQGRTIPTGTESPETPASGVIHILGTTEEKHRRTVKIHVGDSGISTVANLQDLNKNTKGFLGILVPLTKVCISSSPTRSPGQI